MTQEQKAAMERLRTAKAFRGGCPWECTAVYTEGQGKPSVRLQYTLDLEIVSDAYLELIPADDGEPVTEELLASIGFSEYTSGKLMSLDMGWAWLECIPFDGCPEWYLAYHKIPSGPKTRGQLRRLLAALGVTK